MDMPEPIPFKTEWPEPDTRLLRPELPEPPALPLHDILTPRAADWVMATAEGAGAPADYVFAALLCVTGATVGNSRWVSPWRGWAEPPVIWGMCIGNPSAGKSPAIDAVLAPLRRAEKPIRQAAEADLAEWEKQVEIAKLKKETWTKEAYKAIADGREAAPLPDDAEAGTAPHIPRLVVNDGTVERLGVIAERQPKGFLQMRDELAGWLLAMESRNGGSDRAFWLEAFGGRSFTVERMGRAPLSIERLAIPVLGGIQPDRLNDLLTKASDDGLLARFLPVWPSRAPIRQPERIASDMLADEAMKRLTGLQMPLGDDGEPRPWIVGFDHAAQELMNDWRTACAEWEDGAEGLLLSFIGKLPGMAARLSLVFAAIGYAFDNEADPNARQITPAEFGRACHFLEAYALPMARRAYGTASASKNDRAGRKLIAALRERKASRFNAREIWKSGRKGIDTPDAVSAAIAVLEDADLIRAVDMPVNPKGGRPAKNYLVNPVIHEVQS